MPKTLNAPQHTTTHIIPTQTSNIPTLNIRRLGMVSRDYRHYYANGYRDFSAVLPTVLQQLDAAGCDGVLFSLYSLIPRPNYDLLKLLQSLTLQHLHSFLIEAFTDGEPRQAQQSVLYYRTESTWHAYGMKQYFARLAKVNPTDLAVFVQEILPLRMLGHVGILICGESNGVKYAPSTQQVVDCFGVRAAIPTTVNLILNPVHDRMTRFEMLRKRRFLSEQGRWVVSVWNKGKVDSRGIVRDGYNPAWTVFYNGTLVEVKPISNSLGVEMGILNL